MYCTIQYSLGACSVAVLRCQVVFADGTFIDGSTIELSCDGPLREPYAVFCQVQHHGPESRLVQVRARG